MIFPIVEMPANMTYPVLCGGKAAAQQRPQQQCTIANRNNISARFHFGRDGGEEEKQITDR